MARLICFLLVCLHVSAQAQFTLRSDFDHTFMPNEKMSTRVPQASKHFMAEELGQELIVYDISQGAFDIIDIIRPSRNFEWSDNELILFSEDSLWIYDPMLQNIVYESTLAESNRISASVAIKEGVLRVAYQNEQLESVSEYFDLPTRSYIYDLSYKVWTSLRRFEDKMYYKSEDSLFVTLADDDKVFIADSVKWYFTSGHLFTFIRNDSAYYVNQVDQSAKKLAPVKGQNVFYSQLNENRFHSVLFIDENGDRHSYLKVYDAQNVLIDEMELEIEVIKVLKYSSDGLVVSGRWEGGVGLIDFNFVEKIRKFAPSIGGYFIVMEDDSLCLAVDDEVCEVFDLTTLEKVVRPLPQKNSSPFPYVFEGKGANVLLEYDSQRLMYALDSDTKKIVLKDSIVYQLGTPFPSLYERQGMYGYHSKDMYWNPRTEIFQVDDPAPDSVFQYKRFFLYNKVVWLQKVGEIDGEHLVEVKVRDLLTGDVKVLGVLQRESFSATSNGQIVRVSDEFIYDALNDKLYEDDIDIVRMLGNPMFELGDYAYGRFFKDIFKAPKSDLSAAEKVLELESATYNVIEHGDMAVLVNNKGEILVFQGGEVQSIEVLDIHTKFDLAFNTQKDKVLLMALQIPAMVLDLNTKEIDTLDWTPRIRYIGENDEIHVAIEDFKWHYIDRLNFNAIPIDFLEDNEVVTAGNADFVLTYNRVGKYIRFYSMSGDLLKENYWDTDARLDQGYLLWRYGGFLVCNSSFSNRYLVIDLNTGDVVVDADEHYVHLASGLITTQYDGKLFFQRNVSDKGYQIYSLELDPIRVDVQDVSLSDEAAIIAPNPAHAGQPIQLYFDDALIQGDLQIQLLSTQGEVLHSATLDQAQYTLPAHLATGMYVVMVNNSGKTFATKLLVIR